MARHRRSPNDKRRQCLCGFRAFFSPRACNRLRSSEAFRYGQGWQGYDTNNDTNNDTNSRTEAGSGGSNAAGFQALARACIGGVRHKLRHIPFPRRKLSSRARRVPARSLTRRSQTPGPTHHEQREDDQHKHDDDHVGFLLPAAAGYRTILAMCNGCAHSACHRSSFRSLLIDKTVPPATRCHPERRLVRFRIPTPRARRKARSKNLSSTPPPFRVGHPRGEESLSVRSGRGAARYVRSPIIP
jgi:hypothetical protein